MPQYSYECCACGHVQDEIRQLSEGEENLKTSVCEFCEGHAVKIMSLSSFHLSGTCWAKDGYSITKSMADPRNALKV